MKASLLAALREAEEENAQLRGAAAAAAAREAADADAGRLQAENADLREKALRQAKRAARLQAQKDELQAQKDDLDVRLNMSLAQNLREL